MIAVLAPNRRPGGGDRRDAWPASRAEAAARGFIPPATETEAVVQYTPLVTRMARQFARSMPRVADREGLITVGQLAVVRACRWWSPDRGARFLTYLETVIPRAMMRHVYAERNMGLTLLAGVRPNRAHAIDQPVTSGRPGDRTALRTRVEAALRRRRSDFTPAWTDADWDDLWRRLPPRTAEVVRRRLAGETLDAIGRSLGVTRERTRQIEQAGLRKLRQLAGQIPALCDNIPVPEE